LSKKFGYCHFLLFGLFQQRGLGKWLRQNKLSAQRAKGFGEEYLRFFQRSFQIHFGINRNARVKTSPLLVSPGRVGPEKKKRSKDPM
jgi:hypothetical protein